MSATKLTLRPRAFKASRHMRPQQRTFCESSQWQAPVSGAAEAETQSARTYCTNLVLYVFLLQLRSIEILTKR